MSMENTDDKVIMPFDACGSTAVFEGSTIKADTVDSISKAA